MSKRISIRLLARILASIVALLALVGLSMLTIRNGNAYAGEPGRTQRGFSGTGGGTPTPTVLGCPASTMRWSIVPGATLSSNFNASNGLTAINPTDIWAVGYGYDSNTGQSVAVLEHWNGTAWSSVAAPTDPNGNVSLNGAYAISASDVWAVGGNPNSPETDHWNGSSWTISPQPASVIGTSATLNSVAGVATNDVWAVGSNFGTTPLFEHWNGSAWSVVIPADTALTGFLYGVVALASNNAWAVGYTFNNSPSQTLVLHWDGTSWTQVASPDTGPADSNQLSGMSAVSPTDIWAVGVSQASTSSTFEPLTLHWNGSAWSIVATSPLQVDGGGFSGVSAVSANNVWAVGYNYSTFTPLVAHWNGTVWVIGSGQGNGSLSSVVALSNGTAWAVGQSAGDPPLIERYPTLMRTTHCPIP